MDNYIELSSDHVFAKGSVKAITPIVDYGSEDPEHNEELSFKVIGVGFIVRIHNYGNDGYSYMKRKNFIALRDEAIKKLLGD
jgi:hypothetical protein